MAEVEESESSSVKAMEGSRLKIDWNFDDDDGNETFVCIFSKLLETRFRETKQNQETNNGRLMSIQDQEMNALFSNRLETQWETKNRKDRRRFLFFFFGKCIHEPSELLPFRSRNHKDLFVLEEEGEE